MNSRERVIAAINFQKPDRVPVDLNISLTAYKNLCDYIGFKETKPPVPNLAMEVIPNPELLENLGVDLISLKYPSFSSENLKETEQDSWGITYKLVRQPSGEYYEAVENPLKYATIADLDGYNWPSGSVSEEKLEILANTARDLYENTNLAMVGRFGGPIMEIAGNLLGMEEWFIRTVIEPEFIKKLLNIISEICTCHDLQAIDACGNYLQIVKVSGEDLGTQSGPLYSPECFNSLLLPVLKNRWDKVHEKINIVNPEIKVMLHSCGAIKSFIPDLIKSGIEILDPVQPLAREMTPENLSDFFGSIVFHGGIDIQNLLPNGTVEEVRSGVINCLKGFRAEQGGFIAAPSHNVQADVPPENIHAMIEAVKNYNP